MGTTQRMASFISGAKFEDIPTPAVNLAKLCLLDAVGCAIYGTTRPLGRIMTSLVDELGGKPVARVLGTRIETNASTRRWQTARSATPKTSMISPPDTRLSR